MPSYIYRCDNCKTEFETFHSIKIKISECGNCGSESLMRLPQIPNIYKKTEAGEIVREFISDAKHELREQKQESKKVVEDV